MTIIIKTGYMMHSEKYNLILHQMAMECIGINSDNRLIRIEGENPDAIHLMFVCKTDEDIYTFIRAGLPDETYIALKQLPSETLV